MVQAPVHAVRMDDTEGTAGAKGEVSVTHVDRLRMDEDEA